MPFWEGSERLFDLTELPVGRTIGLRLRAGKTAADGVARPAAGNPVSARGKSSRKKRSEILLHADPHDRAKEVRCPRVGKFLGKVLILKIAEAGKVLGLSAEIAGEPFELTAETARTVPGKLRGT
jgi:hypothetical protein